MSPLVVMKKLIWIIGFCFIGNILMAQPLPNDQNWSTINKLFIYITGTWQLDDSNDYEEWLEGTEEFYGRSFSVTQNDTLVSEKLRLYKRSGTVFYQAIVTSQNEGKPVDFRLISCRGGKAIFQNPDHDFPQQISYKLVSGNKLNVTISGNQNGSLKSVDFSFSRLN